MISHMSTCSYIIGYNRGQGTINAIYPSQGCVISILFHVLFSAF